jgi:hypothetical protein
VDGSLDVAGASNIPQAQAADWINAAEMAME